MWRGIEKEANSDRNTQHPVTNSKSEVPSDPPSYVEGCREKFIVR